MNIIDYPVNKRIDVFAAADEGEDSEILTFSTIIESHQTFLSVFQTSGAIRVFSKAVGIDSETIVEALELELDGLRELHKRYHEACKAMGFREVDL